MQKVPRLFVRKRRLVWPTAPRRWTDILKGTDAIVAHARRLYKASDEALYIVDIDGLDHTHANLDLYQSMEQAGVHPWLEAGFRRVDDVMDAFFSGADRVTVRLKDMRPDRFRELTRMTEGEVFLSVGVGRTDLQGGWTTPQVVEFARSAAADGLVLAADHQADAYRLATVGHTVKAAGLPVLVAPWPGTRPDIPDDRADYLLVDGGHGP